MLARFCSRSKPLEEFSARARLGSKIDFVNFACARLGSKLFLLGSLELEKFTLVPNTISDPLMDKFYFMNLEYFLHYYRYNWICLPFRSDSPLAILSVSTSSYQIVHFIIFICAEPSSKKNQEPSKLVSIYLFIFIRNYRIITTGIGNLIALKKVPSFSLKVWTCSIVCSLRFHDIYFLGVFVSQNRK